MSKRISRADVIDYLIAISVKANKNPDKAGFADFIIRKCQNKFGYDKYRAKSFIDTLVGAWRDDKWNYHVKNNPYLTAEEKENWVKEHG